MKSAVCTTAALALAVTTGLAAPAHSNEAPDFVRNTFPDQGVEAAWQSIQSVFTAPDATLDGKTKELIALAVSAQNPCDYCSYAHTVGAEAHGATDAEVREALAAGRSIANLRSMRAITHMASSECPRRSKKSSVTPTGWSGKNDSRIRSNPGSTAS
jgi:AhpD family alkylhydroperoxidase